MSSNVIWRDIFNGPLIDYAPGNQTGLDKFAEPRRRVRVVLVEDVPIHTASSASFQGSPKSNTNCASVLRSVSSSGTNPNILHETHPAP